MPAPVDSPEIEAVDLRRAASRRLRIRKRLPDQRALRSWIVCWSITPRSIVTSNGATGS